MGLVKRAPERFGSYIVYEQLGKGGMATVHRAEMWSADGTMKREVALKRLLPTLNKDLVSFFLDESQLLTYLSHPNIAATYDAGKVFGTYFIAMEYVRGPTLKQLVEHCGKTVGAVPQPITLSLAAQLCDALDHAHNKTDQHGRPLHIVHRDITPANIVLSDTGVLKLIDFGLAKTRVGRSEDTAQGVIKGKFGYVAPEYLGEKALDHRCDLWAVGIIMYELLTSRRLFDGRDAFETMMRVKSLPIPRPSIANPRVTRDLDDIVMSALERDPSRRWQSAAMMRVALQGVMDQPGHKVSNAHVSEWVSWVFKQSPGTEVSGVARLDEIVGPKTTRPTTPVRSEELPGEEEATIVEPTVLPLTRAGLIWYACAIVLAFVLAAWGAWKLVG